MTGRLFIVSLAALGLWALACCPGVCGDERTQVRVLNEDNLGIVRDTFAPTGTRSQSAEATGLRILNDAASTEPLGSEALQWGSESYLSSERQSREPTIWEHYRLQVLTVCAALLVQAGLISLLIHEHRRRDRAELVSRRSTAELARMNRLAAAGELSASIAHEVSQPLTGISAKASAALHWLATEKPDAAKIRDALNDIIDATHRAKDIISSVRLTLKKGEKEKREPMYINRLIQTVLPIMQADLNKEGVELRLDLETKIEILEADATQLQQVIQNLITNAIDAMHSVQPRILTIRTRQPIPGIVRISIEDTGPGVDSENADRIFDRLFTTKPSGMGMGLSICSSIVERHRGHISVSNRVNGGAIFQIELPSIRSVAATSILTHSLVRSTRA